MHILFKYIVPYIGMLIVFFMIVSEYQAYTQTEKNTYIAQEQDKKRQANCLKNALWYEAGNQSLKGIMAVASVIENRKNSLKFPMTYCEVIYQKGQFSYLAKNMPDVEIVQHIDRMSIRAYAKVESVVESIQKGYFKNVLSPSVLFYAHKSISNYWTKTKDTHAVIGAHTFYKETK